MGEAAEGPQPACRIFIAGCGFLRAKSPVKQCTIGARNSVYALAQILNPQHARGVPYL